MKSVNMSLSPSPLDLYSRILTDTNISFKNGIFPSAFKQAIVTPTHKSAIQKKLQFTAQFSQTSNIGFFFKNEVKERMNDYINKNNVIGENTSAMEN